MAGSKPLRVVYLAGSGHTGSTLLALFLDSHPRIVSVGETAFKRKQQRQRRTNVTCTCGLSYEDCPFWQQVFRGVSGAGFDFSPLEWSNDFRYQGRVAHKLLSRYSAKPAWRLLQKAVTAVLPAHQARMDRVRQVNVEFIRTVLSVAGADVFFDTSKRGMRLHQLLRDAGTGCEGGASLFGTSGDTHPPRRSAASLSRRPRSPGAGSWRRWSTSHGSCLRSCHAAAVRGPVPAIRARG